MKNTEQFIKDAIEGGWRPNYIDVSHSEHWFGLSENKSICIPQILHDADAWRAVGKVRRWEKKVVIRRGKVIGNFYTPCSKEHPRGECFKEMGFNMNYLDPWLYYMHELIDALAEGKTADEYLGSI